MPFRCRSRQCGEWAAGRPQIYCGPQTETFMAHSSKKTALLLAGTAAIALGLGMSPASAAPLTATGPHRPAPIVEPRKSSSAAGRRSIPMCTRPRAAPAAGAPISASCPTPRATSRSKRCSGSIRRPTGRRACAPGPRNRGSDLPLPTPCSASTPACSACSARRCGSAGCWRSPMSRSPRRRSPSRCCSAASSMRWPARKAPAARSTGRD